MKTRNSLIAALFLAAPFAAEASSVNLITNGDFEENLAHWTCVTAPDSECIMTTIANTGALAFHGTSSKPDAVSTISQMIETTPGQAYEVVFYAKGTGDDDSLKFQIADSDITNVLLTASYAETSTSFVATDNATLISFLYQSADGGVMLDSVSAYAAAAVPLPPALALMLTGLGMIGATKLRRRT